MNILLKSIAVIVLAVVMYSYITPDEQISGRLCFASLKAFSNSHKLVFDSDAMSISH